MQYKRLLLLLAAVLLVGFGTRAFAAGFPDTDQTLYSDAFVYLSEKGILRGYGDGLARPQKFLNRVEAIKVLMITQEKYAQRVLWYQENMPPLPLFSDVQQSQWFAPFVEAAFEAEVVKGYPEGTLRPGQLLTVEEAVVLLSRSFGEAGETEFARLSATIQNFPGQWYTSSINAAILRNAVLQEQQPLRLGQPITRGQFFEMVYRMMYVREAGVLGFNDGRTVSQGTQSQGASSSHSITLPQPQTVQVINQPQPAVQASTLPYASEKYFAITMPSLGVTDLTITHPIDPLSSQGVLAALKDGVGHLFSYPGAGGKIMIYGHSSGYPWDVSKYTKIFRKVNQLKVGDRIYVTYEGKLHTYEVTYEETIDAKDTAPFNDDAEGEELILYTCWPPDSIAQRYLVHAKPIETVALR